MPEAILDLRGRPSIPRPVPGALHLMVLIVARSECIIFLKAILR